MIALQALLLLLVHIRTYAFAAYVIKTTSKADLMRGSKKDQILTMVAVCIMKA